MYILIKYLTFTSPLRPIFFDLFGKDMFLMVAFRFYLAYFL